jgi:predicted RNase H-like nuclease
MRDVERLMASLFGRFHAGCYPSNLNRPFAARTTAFSAELTAQGFAHAERIDPRAPGRNQIEVHPHAATVNLFCLDRIPKYKKGLVAARRDELRRLRDMFYGLSLNGDPVLLSGALPEVPPAGTSLKDVEDKIDAVLAAYVGAYWWYWGEVKKSGLWKPPRRLHRCSQSTAFM